MLIIAGIVIALGYAVTALVVGTLGNRVPGDASTGLIVTTLILILLGTLIFGCGIGFAFGAMPALIMGAVPATEKAAANGFNSLMRSLGTSIASAVIGVVLAVNARSMGGVSIPAHDSFVISLLIGCGAAIVATLIATRIRPLRDALFKR